MDPIAINKTDKKRKFVDDPAIVIISSINVREIQKNLPVYKRHRVWVKITKGRRAVYRQIHGDSTLGSDALQGDQIVMQRLAIHPDEVRYGIVSNFKIHRVNQFWGSLQGHLKHPVDSIRFPFLVAAVAFLFAVLSIALSLFQIWLALHHS